ncbi:galactan beta-1,4-galactosyltransferase GALS3 [Spinacia oleracea]|uniref:Glycosyltransferase family 92 protein n=1 Tax=Spinacia oleracea TaxID=3562 RepID=A0A9R0IWN8_SPIOL|nr:galactan beta-1,4-galactosyltransferase GALS3 [Spinacia oleracea]
MVKDQRGRKVGGGERNFLIGFSCNYAAAFKLITTALLLLLICTCAVFLQFLPTYFSPFSCSTTTSAETTTASPPPPPPPPKDQILENGAIKRWFNPYGSGAYNFILMSAYRGGPNTFSIIGLSSKPFQVYARPTYTCQYENSNNNNDSSSIVKAYKILPDWGFGRVYTVVVINCTFPNNIANHPSATSRLILHAPSNDGATDSIVALTEPPNSWSPSNFISPPKYDYLYCGSPLYGNLSPQRMREWIAYHVRLFGTKSHFVIFDSGGIHPEVLEVLRPWMELGYVTLEDVREQERFDGYYHNQFLLVNDCLHRYRFDAKWMFFFDVDEYIYLPPKLTLRSVTDSLQEFTQFTIEQVPMSNKLCLNEDAGKTSKKWVIEKLVYRNVKKVARKDRKYAVQPRNVFATGVHLSKNFEGESAHYHTTEKLIKYFHYHGTIATRLDTCQQFLNESSTTIGDETPFVMDTNMRLIAPIVKKFELDTIGTILQSTKQ